MLIAQGEQEQERLHQESVALFLKVHRPFLEVSAPADIIEISSDEEPEDMEGDSKQGEEVRAVSHRGEKVARLVKTFEGHT